MINIFQPSLGKEELDAIAKVFESNWIGKGKFVSEFEKGFAEHLIQSILLPRHVVQKVYSWLLTYLPLPRKMKLLSQVSVLLP